MKKQLVIIGIVVLLLAVGLSGCNEKITGGDATDTKLFDLCEIRNKW